MNYIWCEQWISISLFKWIIFHLNSEMQGNGACTATKGVQTWWRKRCWRRWRTLPVMLVAVERPSTRSPGGADGGSGWEAQLFSAVFLLLYADARTSVFLLFASVWFFSSWSQLGCFLLSAIHPSLLCSFLLRFLLSLSFFGFSPPFSLRFSLFSLGSPLLSSVSPSPPFVISLLPLSSPPAFFFSLPLLCVISLHL